MPIDIVLFRADQGGNPDLVVESQKRRYKGPETVQVVIEADATWRKARYELDQAREKKNKLEEEIKHKRKAKENADEMIASKVEVEKKIEQLIKDEVALAKKVDSLMRPIGNIVHSSVPIEINEDFNKIERQWGDFKKSPDFKHHHELLYMIDGYEPERGVNVAAHRGYFLKGIGVQLNFALIQYGMDFLMKRNYTMLQPPYFMLKDVMANTAQLEQFDEELYKVVEGGEEEQEKYLIATSEQPISAFHQNEWLEIKSLPLRYGGISTCFRKEAGSHGKDTWGIFRVHQFEKVEQFCITSPETSWEMHEEMLKTSQDFYESLNIPYRVVNIVSGALNNAAAKKYDLEGWFPGFAEFRELVSCSNCTDYQSRSLEIRYGAKKQGEREKKYVHMLNGTLCATTRTICAILENYQTPEGVQVPKVLQPYLGGKEFIPFVKKDLPKTKGAKGKAQEQKKKEPTPAPKDDPDNNAKQANNNK